MTNIVEAIKPITQERSSLRPILRDSKAKIAELPAPPQKKLLNAPLPSIYEPRGYIKVKKHDFL